MREINEIKEVFITRAKANATIIALLPSSDNIKETEWMGSDFTFPAVRLTVREYTPENASDCVSEASLAWIVFSESTSSKECDKIASVIGQEFHLTSFSTGGIMFTVKVLGILSAVAQEVNLWRSEVQLHVKVSP